VRAPFFLGSSLLSLSLVIGCGGGAETTGGSTTTSTNETTASSSTTATSTGGTGGTGTGGSGGGTTTTTSSTATTSTSSSSTGGAGGGGCGRVPGPVDAPRKVVISHPYDSNGGKANTWEVLDLDPSGTLTKTGTTFDMGRAFWGEVAFTPDGKVGIVAQEDGALGVMRFDDAGAVTVVHASFQGSFYAELVVMDPSGDGAFILDPNFRNNGGGLYRVAIGCDGTLTDLGMVAPSKLARGMVRLGATPSLAVLASADVLASAAGDNAHLLDLSGAAPALVAGAPAFPDNNAIVSSVARTHDDRYALIGDNSEFDPPNRVSVVRVTGNALVPTQLFTSIEDPYSIVTSPFDNAALVVSGYGNAIFGLGYDPNNATSPFVVDGEIAYVGKAPALPATAVMIDRGALRGRVLVSELSGVRQVRFEQDGNITDLGPLAFGSGLQNIVGAIGVMP
jgi:hypothetical protein